MTDTPRLLTGGNPQIAKGHGDEPVQAYIAAMPGWKRDVGHRIDTLVESAVPDVQKAVKWNQPMYGFGDDVWFVSFRCFTRYIKVTFFDGAALDPLPPVASKHDKVRYLHIHQGDAVEEPLAGWIEQASRLPGEKL